MRTTTPLLLQRRIVPNTDRWMGSPCLVVAGQSIDNSISALAGSGVSGVKRNAWLLTSQVSPCPLTEVRLLRTVYRNGSFSSYRHALRRSAAWGADALNLGAVLRRRKPVAFFGASECDTFHRAPTQHPSYHFTPAVNLLIIRHL